MRSIVVTLLAVCCLLNLSPAPCGSAETAPRTYTVTGLVKGLDVEKKTVTVEHQEVAAYMPAMTMPFEVRDRGELSGLKAGDQVEFTLKVTPDDSWIERIKVVGSRKVEEGQVQAAAAKPDHPLMQVQFTNQFGAPVRLRDFKGQALAITFFFTRCPVPNFCPRLSKNFQEASEKLLNLPSAPTNWHFLSVTFDTDYDTPTVLKAYSQMYQCEPAHWSFLTGPSAAIRELAALSDATFAREGALFNHNFRTLIIDAAGHLQMSFPIGGNLSEALVQEILKAARVEAKPAES